LDAFENNPAFAPELKPPIVWYAENPLSVLFKIVPPALEYPAFWSICPCARLALAWKSRPAACR
jgi:hypothetical protein